MRSRLTLSVPSLRRLLLMAAFVCAVLFLISVRLTASGSTFASVEYKFADASTHGLAIIPASCPSFPHYSGECGGDYSQGGYGGNYSQGGYGGNYSQGGYYAESSYYAEASYGPTCTPAYFCSGSDLYYRTASCSESRVARCAYGCAGSACLPPPPPTGTISARPSLVPEGRTVEVIWSSEHTASCTVTGNNANGGTSGDSWTGLSGTETSKPINSQVTFTLRCTGIDGSSITKTATVNIIPRENEI